MERNHTKSKGGLVKRLPVICFGLSLVCLIVFGAVAVRQIQGGGQPTPPPVVTASPEAADERWEKNEDGILNIYAPYYEENNEMIGWLSIEDTNINYPVVWTPGNNEKYLRKGFDGQYAEGGTLFLDEHCRAEEGNYTSNLMIYGHDMNDGTMFGKLELYADESYGLDHSTIWFDTLHERGEYRLLAAFYSKVYYTTDTCFKYYKFFDAANKAEFDDYVSNVKQLAEYETGVMAEYGDTLLTLSTCSNHVENGRFVVVAKKVN